MSRSGPGWGRTCAGRAWRAGGGSGGAGSTWPAGGTGGGDGWSCGTSARGKWMRAPKRVQGVGQSEFTEFYKSNRDRCLRAVLAGTGDRQLAEDLVAEAFTRAWMSWHKVRRHPVPSAWVVRTAL